MEGCPCPGGCPCHRRVETVMSQRKEFVALAREGVIERTVFAQWDQPQDWLQVAGRYTLKAESSVWMISRSALITPRTGRATTWSSSS